MKNLTSKLVAIGLFFASISVVCQARDDLPDPVKQGLVAYAEGNFNIATDIWLKNAVLENPNAVKKELDFASVERLYGIFDGYELVKETVLSSRAKRMYVAINYERGPLWLYFDVFQKRDGTWTINAIKMNKNAEELFPEGYLGHK
jgi:hypothetical protein